MQLSIIYFLWVIIGRDYQVITIYFHTHITPCLGNQSSFLYILNAMQGKTTVGHRDRLILVSVPEISAYQRIFSISSISIANQKKVANMIQSLILVRIGIISNIGIATRVDIDQKCDIVPFL